MSSKEQQAKEKRIVKGIKEILEFRGFQIKKTNEDDDFLDIYAQKTLEEGEKISAIARYPKNPQIGVKLIRVLGKLQEEEELDEALLIAEAPLTHYAKKESVKLGIEIISSSNPLFNIFDHELVPHHIKLNSREIKSFLTRYQISKHQIPKILETDPAVKAIQAKPGDVIRIVRNPDMGEDGAYYRVVIKSTSRLRLTETATAKKKKSTTKKTKVTKVTKDEETKEEDKEETKETKKKETKTPTEKTPTKTTKTTTSKAKTPAKTTKTTASKAKTTASKAKTTTSKAKSTASKAKTPTKTTKSTASKAKTPTKTKKTSTSKAKSSMK